MRYWQFWSAFGSPERVSYGYRSVSLSVVQIPPENRAARLDGAAEDHRVPRAHLITSVQPASVAHVCMAGTVKCPAAQRLDCRASAASAVEEAKSNILWELTHFGITGCVKPLGP